MYGYSLFKRCIMFRIYKNVAFIHATSVRSFMTQHKYINVSVTCLTQLARFVAVCRMAVCHP